MSDLISRSALLKEMDISPDEWAKGRTIEGIINEQPAVDAVEVVRCGNCVYKDIPKCCPYQINGFTVPYDWYCPMGVKEDT